MFSKFKENWQKYSYTCSRSMDLLIEKRDSNIDKTMSYSKKKMSYSKKKMYFYGEWNTIGKSLEFPLLVWQTTEILRRESCHIKCLEGCCLGIVMQVVILELDYNIDHVHLFFWKFVQLKIFFFVFVSTSFLYSKKTHQSGINKISERKI